MMPARRFQSSPISAMPYSTCAGVEVLLGLCSGPAVAKHLPGWPVGKVPDQKLFLYKLITAVCVRVYLFKSRETSQVGPASLAQHFIVVQILHATDVVFLFFFSVMFL